MLFNFNKVAKTFNMKTANEKTKSMTTAKIPLDVSW
jgi:hypothetical protein